MSLYPLYLVNFINALGFSIVIPYLVFWATDFGGSPALYGALGATYAGFQLLGAPMLGTASDYYGRKKILFLSQLGTLISWIGILFALLSPRTLLGQFESDWLGRVELTLPLILLVVARAFDGLTAGNISIANAYLSDVSSEKDKSKNFGRMSAASSLGFIIGPSIAGLLEKDVWATYMAMGVSMVGLFCIVGFLKELKPSHIKKNPCGQEVKRQLGAEVRDCNDKIHHGFFDIIKDRSILQMFFLYFVIYLAFNLFYSTFPLMAKNNLEWTSKQIGFFFSVMGACLVIVQFFVLPKAGEQFSQKSLLVIGALCLATSKFLLLFESQFIWLMPVMFAMGNGILWPSFLAILSSYGTPEDQGSIQGYGSSFGSSASIIGLLLGSILFAQYGSMIYIGAALMFILVALLSLRVNLKVKTAQDIIA